MPNTRRYKVPRKRRKRSKRGKSKRNFWKSLKNTPINNQEAQLLGLLVWLGLDYKYVGNAGLIVGKKCPDYVNGDGTKLIELFGTRYHKKAEVAERTEYFAKMGYDTLIIWSPELQFRNRNKLVQKIMDFENGREDNNA